MDWNLCCIDYAMQDMVLYMVGVDFILMNGVYGKQTTFHFHLYHFPLDFNSAGLEQLEINRENIILRKSIRIFC